MKFVDKFIIAKVSVMWTAATVYLFMHATEVNFATWATFGATVAGVYHWLTIKDDKTADATNG